MKKTPPELFTFKHQPILRTAELDGDCLSLTASAGTKARNLAYKIDGRMADLVTALREAPDWVPQVKKPSTEPAPKRYCHVDASRITIAPITRLQAALLFTHLSNLQDQVLHPGEATSFATHKAALAETQHPQPVKAPARLLEMNDAANRLGMREFARRALHSRSSKGHILAD